MKAIEYFYELTKIPRPSGKEDKVVEFLVNYAKSKNLDYEINGVKNVIIKKNNHSDKYIILQAHTDMVCEKLPNITIDFENEGIRTIQDGDILRADGTTLGADDGYGVSTILQILDECGEGYPNIEAIFTSDEEVGMTGASTLDLTNIKSKMIIGLDGTSSSEITVSSAGGMRIEFKTDIEKENVLLDGYRIKIGGLLGGHSGEDINKNRANANKLAFEFLSNLSHVVISSYEGGNKDNAIPRDAVCVFYSEDNGIKSKFYEFVDKVEQIYSEENITIKLENFRVSTLLKKDISDNLINFVNEFENGVLIYDEDDKTFPITSINLAKIEIDNGSDIIIRAMLRSSDSEYEKEYVEHYQTLGKKYNFESQITNRSPYFERSKDGKLVDICVKSYEELGYKDLKVSGIHAGLEGGVFADKIKNAQIVCLGADLQFIHTPDEFMKISSLEKLSDWIKRILINL